jgi:glycerophosphoryl diester phosphodiesterase
MERKNILAHRGCWSQHIKKNSFEALKMALDAGFGIETDFRDYNETVVVSHDPPGANVLTARAFFELYAELGANSRIAINIKADGLQNALISMIDDIGILIENCFAFDMAVPDALSYVSNGFPTYTRVSEYELEAPFMDLATGVWIDNFTGRFDQVATAQRLLSQGNRVCIVSSELHKRDHSALWSEIAAAGINTYPEFELCTDFPEAAHQFFLNQDGD